MRDPMQDTLQKTLMFEPHLRISLPEGVQPSGRPAEG